ncbi:MAG: hypothetical protein ACLQM8_19375 [Limisphaerales bacterium]
MKRKIGTVVDDNLYHDVKLLAAQERRRISEVVQLALHDYVQRSRSRVGDRVGLARLLEPDPLKLTPEQFKASMEADFFDQ